MANQYVIDYFHSRASTALTRRYISDFEGPLIAWHLEQATGLIIFLKLH
jgi:hypothetical protein